MIRALFLTLVLVAACGSTDTRNDGNQCPTGVTCTTVCPLTTQQEIYYLNKPDHDTGYKQDTQYGGSIYCQGGQINFQNDRNGSYSVLSPGTYGEGEVGTLCGFTIDASCAISGRQYPN